MPWTISTASTSAPCASPPSTGSDGAITREQLDAALASIAAEFARLDGVAPPEALVGMGGAITNMTAVMLHLEDYDPDAVQGAVLGRGEVDRQIEFYRTRDADA